MKRTNQFFFLFLMTVLLFLKLPLQVSANGPAPAPWYTVELEGLPAGTAYVDMLIYLTEDDPMYTEPEASDLPDGIAVNAEIITYCEGDYRSYTFHYKDAQSVIDPDAQQVIRFFVDDTGNYICYSHADDIAQRGDICLAMLDREGNILKVSPLLSQDTNKFMAYTLGTYRYDATSDEWEVVTAFSSWGLLLYVVISVCGVVLTCFLEHMIAMLFRIDQKYGQVVLVTNYISQVLMRVAFILFYSLVFWKYDYALFVLELCVYIGEYLVYRWWMRELSWKRCLVFTICANTVSLVLGSVLNSLILFN